MKLKLQIVTAAIVTEWKIIKVTALRYTNWNRVKVLLQQLWQSGKLKIATAFVTNCDCIFRVGNWKLRLHLWQIAIASYNCDTATGIVLNFYCGNYCLRNMKLKLQIATACNCDTAIQIGLRCHCSNCDRATAFVTICSCPAATEACFPRRLKGAKNIHIVITIKCKK
jgi:hypothetical protein